MVEETERASKNQAAMAGQTDAVRGQITELTTQRHALQGAVDAVAAPPVAATSNPPQRPPDDSRTLREDVHRAERQRGREVGDPPDRPGARLRAEAHPARPREAGVRVYYYSTGEELRLDTPVHDFMSAAKNFGNQWYRHQVRTKTREAMRARAAKGYLTGGRVLGYTTATTDGVAKRVVDPEQAENVRRVFAMCAEGKGIHRIAKTLNAEGVPNPTGQDRITGKKASVSMWSSTGVRESCIASCTAAWSRTAKLAGRIAAASR